MTLSEFLAANPDVKHIQVVRPSTSATVTTQYDAIEIDKKFRTKLALMDAFEHYIASALEDRMTTDDRIQDMIDHSLGELKFTVEVT